MGKTLDAMSLQELWADHATELAAADAVYKELPADGDPPQALLDAAATHNKAVYDLELEIKARAERAGTLAELQATHQARKAALRQPVGDLPFPGGDGGRKADRPRQTPTDILLTDPRFKAWRDDLIVDGHVAGVEFKHSPRVQLTASLKDLVTGASDTSGGALVTPDYKPFIALPYQPVVMRDIITIGTTASDTVSYPRETSRTNNAAVVAEATDVADGTGGKPQSTFALERDETSVKTIAHWVAVTRQALADAGQLRPYIDQFLMKGLDLAWESQVLTGTGSAGTLTGILNTSGTTPQAFSTDLFTTYRKARTTALVTGLAEASAFILNPTDWEALDLTFNNMKNFYLGGPAVLGAPRLWGLPVVQSRFLSAGTALTGDFSTIIWYDRQVVQLFMSDSHQDFFVRNLVAVLAELRGALALLRPAAIVKIALS